MDNQSHTHPSHFFTLRLWLEETDESGREWRGQLQHVASGEARYFRDWHTLISHLRGILEEPTADLTSEPGS